MTEIRRSPDISGSSQAKGRSNDICIWVVPPFSSKVRKLRMKLWSLCLVGFLSFVTLSGMSFVAGDYVRLQIQRARNYLFVKSLTHERDSLKNSNSTLHSQLEQLKNEQGRMALYEKNIRERLGQLQEVVAAVQAMGVVPPNEQREAKAHPLLKGADGMPKDGIGGAELECKPGDIRCSTLFLDGDESAEVSFGERVKRNFLAPFRYMTSGSNPFFSTEPELSLEDENKLLADLDTYITTLKTLPFALPGQADITSGFGHRRSPFSSGIALHEGIDFSMPAGADVLSTGDGIVKEVRFTPTYGLVIDIEHTPQVVTRYAHLRRATVNVGEKVSRGTVIGAVGSTGRSTGPHLHYEIRVDGAARNPEDMIALGERLSNLF